MKDEIQRINKIYFSVFNRNKKKKKKKEEEKKKKRKKERKVNHNKDFLSFLGAEGESGAINIFWVFHGRFLNGATQLLDV